MHWADSREEFRKALSDLPRAFKDEELREEALAALKCVTDIDVMRLLLCAFQNLSLRSWFRFNSWWGLIVGDVVKLSFRTVFKMYKKRCELVCSA